MTSRTLVVVLTDGEQVRTPGRLPSSPVGLQRLRTAIAEAKKLKAADIIICGGRRRNPAYSEAQLLESEGATELESLKAEQRTRTFVQAEAKCTVDDMVALARWLKRQPYNRLAICAHPDHAALAKHVLKICGVTTPISSLPSGETSPYSSLELRYLRFLSRVDPLWQTPLAWPLRLVVSLRGWHQ